MQVSVRRAHEHIPTSGLAEIAGTTTTWVLGPQSCAPVATMNVSQARTSSARLLGAVLCLLAGACSQEAARTEPSASATAAIPSAVDAAVSLDSGGELNPLADGAASALPAAAGSQAAGSPAAGSGAGGCGSESFAAIYRDILASPTYSCSSAPCHGRVGMLAAVGNLDLSTPAAAYTALVSKASDSTDCAGKPRVTPAASR